MGSATGTGGPLREGNVNSHEENHRPHNSIKVSTGYFCQRILEQAHIGLPSPAGVEDLAVEATNGPTLPVPPLPASPLPWQTLPQLPLPEYCPSILPALGHSSDWCSPNSDDIFSLCVVNMLYGVSNTQSWRYSHTTRVMIHRTEPLVIFHFYISEASFTVLRFDFEPPSSEIVA